MKDFDERKEARNKFVNELIKLGNMAQSGYGPAKASLARLRRTFSDRSISPSALRETGQWFSKKLYESDIKTMLIIAALFAINPNHADKTSLGLSLNLLKQKIKVRNQTNETPSLDLRFQSILNSDAEDLPYRLRLIMLQLAAENIGIDWYRLLEDMIFWDHFSDQVKFKWAMDFYKSGE